MTKQQKKNSLEDFYVKPARKSKFLSKEDFGKSMRWGAVIWFVIGAILFILGGLGMLGVVTTNKAPVFAITGLFFCFSSILLIAFPGFRRFFDGGTLYDIFVWEAKDLAATWEKVIPDLRIDQLNLDDPLFWGTTSSMSCIVLVKCDRPDSSGDEFFLAAHCDKSRKGKPHPLIGKGKCVGLSRVFEGDLEEIEQQMKELTNQSFEAMRQAIEINSKMQLDPLIYSPFSSMLCSRS